MSIRRKAKRTKWTTLDNELINDGSLDFAALGALVYILSKPDDWVIRVSDMQRRGGCGRTAMRAMMKRLEVAGYAELVEIHSATGLAGSSWVVSEDKAPGGAVTVRFPDGQAMRQSGGATVRGPAPLVSTDSVLMTDVVPKTEKDIARDDAAPETSPPSESKRKPVKTKAPPAPRAPKPMYDAFKAAFPTAQPWEAQTFDTATTAEGLTVERWHAFMATSESRQDYPRYLTRKNATDRFIGWSRSTRRDPTREAGDNGASLAARNEAFLKAKGWA